MFRLALRPLLAIDVGFVGRSSSSQCLVDVDRCAKEMCLLVTEAAEHMRRASRSNRIVETKTNDKDLVTAVDREIEQLVAAGLKRQFADHVYVGEEGLAGPPTSRKLTDAPTWFIDPIDGTANFVHGFPYCCVSVAMWLNKQPELAICHNPILNLRLTARRCRGAFLNGIPIRASGQTKLLRALIMHNMSASNLGDEHKDKQRASVIDMLDNAQTVRSTGSSAMDMCLVAMGAADGYLDFTAHSWNLAAGTLLIREAGGVVMDPAGGEFDLMSRRILAAATPPLGKQIVQLLGDNQIFQTRDDVNQ